MNRKFLASLALLLCLTTTFAQSTDKTPSFIRKKVIEYGWDVPYADYVSQNIAQMEKLPFDGLIFKLRSIGVILSTKPADPEKLKGDFEACKAIKTSKFTDNFIIGWAASEQDWFDDAHWEVILQNTKNLAKAAKLANCVGICFDHEPYGFNPWSYAKAKHRETKTFLEYEAIARKRGAQFARALESEFPGLKVLTFFQLSYFASLCKPMEPAKRAELLANNGYAFLPAFLNGMLDAATPNLMIIDGNENAYYYTNQNQYYEVYHRVKQSAEYLIDPANWYKYKNQVQAGQALYIDYYFDMGSKSRRLNKFLTPEEQALWFEHNIYWAMKTTDEYVWCYSERMNWWLNRTVPPGCEDAIVKAREAHDEGKPFTKDLKSALDKGRERQAEELGAKLVKPKATIPKIPANIQKPQIDGKFDGQAWENAIELNNLVGVINQTPEVKAKTSVKACYDDKALYLAVTCNEPEMNKLIAPELKRDDANIWKGDSLELFFAAPEKKTPVSHLIVNPSRSYWDALHLESSNDLGFNPTWQFAVTKQANAWLVEFEIPWAAMTVTPPKPGSTISVNICRQRSAGNEWSSWSPLVSGFLEFNQMGTFTFQK